MIHLRFFRSSTQPARLPVARWRALGVLPLLVTLSRVYLRLLTDRAPQNYLVCDRVDEAADHLARPRKSNIAHDRATDLPGTYLRGALRAWLLVDGSVEVEYLAPELLSYSVYGRHLDPPFGRRTARTDFLGGDRADPSPYGRWSRPAARKVRRLGEMSCRQIGRLCASAQHVACHPRSAPVGTTDQEAAMLLPPDLAAATRVVVEGRVEV